MLDCRKTSLIDAMYAKEYSLGFDIVRIILILVCFFLQPLGAGKYIFDLGCEQHGEYIHEVNTTNGNNWRTHSLYALELMSD